jgi:pimeloyl-ACP methyl ester carboxylesterase
LLDFVDSLELDTFHVAGHDWGTRTAYAACVFAPKGIKSLLTLATPYVAYGGRNRPPEEAVPIGTSGFFNLIMDAE